MAAGGDHRLIDAVGNAHGTASYTRQGRGDRLHLGIGLAAEAAAEIRDDYLDCPDREGEEVGKLGADEEGMLAGGPDGEIVLVVPTRDRRVWLQGVLEDRGEGVFALDDNIGGGEDLFNVAAGEGVVVADVARLETNLAQTVKESTAERNRVVQVRCVGF